MLIATCWWCLPWGCGGCGGCSNSKRGTECCIDDTIVRQVLDRHCCPYHAVDDQSAPHAVIVVVVGLPQCQCQCCRCVRPCSNPTRRNSVATNETRRLNHTHRSHRATKLSWFGLELRQTTTTKLRSLLFLLLWSTTPLPWTTTRQRPVVVGVVLVVVGQTRVDESSVDWRAPRRQATKTTTTKAKSKTTKKTTAPMPRLSGRLHESLSAFGTTREPTRLPGGKWATPRSSYYGGWTFLLLGWSPTPWTAAPALSS